MTPAPNDRKYDIMGMLTSSFFSEYAASGTQTALTLALQHM